MYINSVLSFLGAWQKLNDDYPVAFAEIQQVLNSIDLKSYSEIRTTGISALNRAITHAFTKLNWDVNTRMPSGRNGHKFREMDFIKNSIGVEFSFTRQTVIESDMFFKYPLFIRSRQFQLIVILVPMKSLQMNIGGGTGNFEIILDRLTDLHPNLLKYPFVVLGLTDAPSTLDVQELTSDFDRFLIESVGLSFSEMKILTEQEQYDFKRELPESRRFAHLICALANLQNGGVVLLGVNDDGNIIGLPRGRDLDELKLEITNIIRNNCRPCPNFRFFPFDDPADTNQCVLAVRVSELEYKPCMVAEKVYVRVGSSTRAADSDQIRRLFIR